MKQIDYRGLAALDAVIDHGSFDKAALALSITQSAVSQRIRMLENSAGELLIVRSQPPVPTAAGQRLIAHYRQVRLLEAALLHRPDSGEARPEIAIAVNADSAATWVQEAVTPLMLSGQCLLHIRLDDQDHTLTMLREGRVFGCVTSESAQVAGTTSTPLGIMRYHCVASPAFARRWFPDGMTAAAVQQAPALNFDRKDALQERYIARRTGYGGHYPHHSLASSDGFVRFIEAGFGYGMVPLLQCEQQLKAGTLVEMTPGDTLDVPLIWHRWDIQTALTRTLSDNMIATARKWLL
ncbi:LysR family transcriptional regulator ArgP [Duganella violaceipulchra]|uniref:LysR family transcriptional regulator (Chromosome initiation inhibitor) n=1 Tax=Duganella violaceipulchra TaxID=2849652 RepID=A0AA41L6P1_9BURK|nr:LysR family transcriptional regulator ArgP [Duganella violaceicalia]MBV6320410.1 LysR family transcriptional regulator ArgP [Duganella violaceicalia]MCP2012245.1 LysR family transcriptional regulator (chromosome initiation inhibitor) [Duganella violaceicalia]